MDDTLDISLMAGMGTRRRSVIVESVISEMSTIAFDFGSCMYREPVTTVLLVRVMRRVAFGSADLRNCRVLEVMFFEVEAARQRLSCNKSVSAITLMS